jgi:hypothetical protein
MTIFGTPGGTPLNTTPFQGTAPGNPAQVTLQPLIPAVGMFPPGATVANGGQVSGDSVIAACARAALPINTYVNNEGVGNNISVADALSTGTDGGNAASAANGIPFGSAAGGGASPIGGQGGMNMNNNVGAVGDVALGGQANPGNLTYQGGGANPNQFAG